MDNHKEVDGDVAINISSCVVYSSSAAVSQEPYVIDGAVLCIIYPPFHKSHFYHKKSRDNTLEYF